MNENHSWFVRTLRTIKTVRTLRTIKTVRTLRTIKTERTKKPKAHFYFPEIKYKVTIHILVQWLNLVYYVLKCKSEFPWIKSEPGHARILHV